jgi:hypothetical protein
LSGYLDLTDVIPPEKIDYFCYKADFNNDPKDLEELDRACSLLHEREKLDHGDEINPKALEYFPDDMVSAIFFGQPEYQYQYPQAPELFNVWKEEYRELLMLKGHREHEFGVTF